MSKIHTVDWKDLAATMKERIFGVDGEMSGAEIHEGHKLIQIGVAVDTTPDGELLDKPDLFVSLIGWNEEDLVWSERAEQVHHIDRETVLAAPPAYEVDEALCEWLFEHGADPDSRRHQVMVGFNVGVFDGPFIQQALPHTKSFFARRYGDLNPLCFVLASSRIDSYRGAMNSASWKRRLKRIGLAYAQDTGRTELEHDAGTDALQALGAWRHVEETLQRVDEDATAYRRRERERRIAQN